MADNIMRPVRRAAAALRLAPEPDPGAKETIPTVTLDLPSQGVFYDGVRSIQVARTLSVNQVRSLHGIRALQSEYNRKRELINIIGRSIRGIDYLDLTWSDFRYVLYWLRLNTYKPNPYQIQWEYRVGDETRKVLSRVSINDYRIVELDRHRTYPYLAETVRMRLEVLELEDEEDRWYAQYAVHYPRGTTLREKMDLLDAHEDTVLAEIRQFQHDSRHGLYPTLKLTDPDHPEAGEFEYELTLEVDDFFP